MIDAPLALRRALLQLMKGLVFREQDAALWQGLLAHEAAIRDYVTVLNLELFLDETEGHAYLRQRPSAPGESDPLPRLVPRRQLSYSVSVLLLLLRRKLVELDVKSGETRLILLREEIAELMRTYAPDGTNEVKHRKRVDQDLAKVADMGFIRPLGDDETRIEVRRVLKAFVDADWMTQMLARYDELAGASSAEAEE